MIEFSRSAVGGGAFSYAGLWFPGNAISLKLCLPYIAGLSTLIIGVVRIRNDFLVARGLDRIIVLGPMFLAVPMAVFGADHFVFLNFVVRIVPSWIPWHLFWALFVGFCLIAGALGLALRRYEILAAALFGTMMFLFVLLMHIPFVVQFPKDRLAWSIFFRDLTFGTGALCFAAAHAPARWTRPAKIFLTLAPFEIGIASIFFASQHFLHPQYMPGIPLEDMTPQWVSVRVPAAYVTGVVLLITGVAMLWNRWTKLAAIALSVMLLLLVIVLYLPIVIVQPWAIETGLNYLADTLMFSAIVLGLAGSYGGKLTAYQEQRGKTTATVGAC